MKRNYKKIVLLAASLLLVMCAAIGGTVAYLIDTTGEVKNTFEPAKVPPEVVEKIEGNVKKEVTIKNTGNVDAYIRVKVVVTWKDASGNVYKTAPVKDTDYTWTDGDNKWVKHTDGFYYYTKSVAAGESTAVLFTDCKQLSTANVPEDNFLSVDIHAQTVQAEPSSVVEETWGVVITEGSDMEK